MSRDGSLKGFSNALKPWWISLLSKMYYVFELLYVAYQDAYLLYLICALEHCAHSLICAQYIFVTSDVASRRVV